MSWKSETRRKVENLLDRLANGEVGHANTAAELEELSGCRLDRSWCARDVHHLCRWPVAE
jgi:hypothetical protein